MTTSTAILYFSGYGHTAKQAEAVAEGASGVNGNTATLIAIDKEGNITEAQWKILTEADAILFGSPTYMGGPAWQFKKIADASSKIWFSNGWKDKLAAGFTTSGAMNGDKASTLQYFITLAMQHGMVWIGTGLHAASTKTATRNDVNFLGGFSGALAQAPVDSSPEEGPLPGDLETARLLGARVATYLQR